MSWRTDGLAAIVGPDLADNIPVDDGGEAGTGVPFFRVGPLPPAQQRIKDALAAIASAGTALVGPDAETTTAGDYTYVDASPHTLAAAASVSQDVYTVARMVASEEGRGSSAEKLALAEAARNKAAQRGVSVTSLLTSSTHGAPFSGRYGEQAAGRWASTSKRPNASHIAAAQAALVEGTDIASGAVDFFDPSSSGKPQNGHPTRGTTAYIADAASHGLVWIGPVDSIRPDHVMLFRKATAEEKPVDTSNALAAASNTRTVAGETTMSTILGICGEIIDRAYGDGIAAIVGKDKSKGATPGGSGTPNDPMVFTAAETGQGDSGNDASAQVAKVAALQAEQYMQQQLTSATNAMADSAYELKGVAKDLRSYRSDASNALTKLIDAQNRVAQAKTAGAAAADGSREAKNAASDLSDAQGDLTKWKAKLATAHGNINDKMKEFSDDWTAVTKAKAALDAIKDVTVSATSIAGLVQDPVAAAQAAVNAAQAAVNAALSHPNFGGPININQLRQNLATANHQLAMAVAYQNQHHGVHGLAPRQPGSAPVALTVPGMVHAGMPAGFSPYSTPGQFQSFAAPGQFQQFAPPPPQLTQDYAPGQTFNTNFNTAPMMNDPFGAGGGFSDGSDFMASPFGDAPNW